MSKYKKKQVGVGDNQRINIGRNITLRKVALDVQKSGLHPGFINRYSKASPITATDSRSRDIM